MVTNWYILLFSEIWKKKTHADCELSKHPFVKQIWTQRGDM
jgi:hypothetical protein